MTGFRQVRVRLTVNKPKSDPITERCFRFQYFSPDRREVGGVPWGVEMLLRNRLLLAALKVRSCQ